MKKLLSALAVAAAFLPSLSQATIVTSTTGLTTYDKLVTFSTPSLAENTVVTSQYAAQGLTFAALNGGAVRANSCGKTAYNGFTAFNGDYLNTYGSGCTTNRQNDSFSILFVNDVSAASIGMYNSGSNNSFTALLNGAVVQSFTASSYYIGYLKFSDIVFDEIRFTETSFAQDGFLAFDNVAYVNAVPEPTTVALLGLGLLGFAVSRRKAAKK